ncbi:MAG: hypothetical protein TEF_12605 [Rhizobiales bacterium NRL2]|nr:MAG: hypothetical protein TEF_12605 [Rhizobiales bacterium NRL2]
MAGQSGAPDVSGEPRWSANARRALGIVRVHLGMDVAYLSRIDAGDLVLEVLDNQSAKLHLKENDRFSLQDTYTPYILRHELPPIIPDTIRDPIAEKLAITRDIPIGSFASSPITFRDGTVFGQFCCASILPNPGLSEQDPRILALFAEMVSHDIEAELTKKSTIEHREATIRRIIDDKRFSYVHQEIWDAIDGTPVGAECLARISELPRRSPDQWFKEAEMLGMGAPFEMATLSSALDTLVKLPAPRYLSVNASPHAILDPGFEALFAHIPLARIVLEITEHQVVENYRSIERVLRPLRRRGLRLAVDDAGAGYASLSHILELRPDIIKLDAALVHRADSDRDRRALIDALVTYGQKTGIEMIAEGVETRAEMEVLKALGIRLMQGYFLSPPGLLGNSSGCFG